MTYGFPTFQNQHHLEFDLSVPLKVKFNAAVGLPKYDFMLIFNSNNGLTRLLYEIYKHSKFE